MILPLRHSLFCLFVFLNTLPAAHASALTSAGDFISSNARYVAHAHAAAHQDIDGTLQLVLANHAGRWTKAWLKDEVQRSRPDGTDQRSFPSGHTMKASVPAWYVTERYGWREGWPYHVGVAVAGAARVEQKRHYAEDVIGTHLLAWGVTRLVTGRDGAAPPVGVTVERGVRLHFFGTF